MCAKGARKGWTELAVWPLAVRCLLSARGHQHAQRYALSAIGVLLYDMRTPHSMMQIWQYAKLR